MREDSTIPFGPAGEKLTICVDFDGVLHNYTSYNEGRLNDPVPGAAAALRILKRMGHTIIIHTTRGEDEISSWLSKNGFVYDHFNRNPEDTELPYPTGNPGKPRADVYIDDRGMTFNGIWDGNFINQIVSFRPWNKR